MRVAEEPRPSPAPAVAPPPDDAGRAPAVPVAKRARRTLRYAGIVVVLALVRLLPLRVARAFGRALGSLAFHVFRRDRQLALEHLGRALPELSAPERERTVRRMFRGFGDGAVELALAHRLDRTLERHVEVDPAVTRALQEGVARGKGTVAVTGHVGNWELLFRRFVHAGLPACAVGKESHDPRLNALVERLRGPGRTIWRGADGSAKQLLRAFRDNRVVAMLIDQDTNVQGVFVPFFGELAHTPRAAADLALRKGAAVVAVFIHRREDGGHLVTGGPIELPGSGDREADVVALTAAMTQAIEREVRRTPHEWVWMHRRWKTRP